LLPQPANAEARAGGPITISATENAHSTVMIAGPVIHKGISKRDSNICPVFVARRLETASARDVLVRQPQLQRGFLTSVVSLDCGRRRCRLQIDGHLFDLAIEFERHRIACADGRALVGANIGAFIR
jgi:hypothetical protein